MSIVSNEWYTVPTLDHFGYYEQNPERRKRRFFDSGLRWDSDARLAVMNYNPRYNLREAMEAEPPWSVPPPDESMEVEEEMEEEED